MWEGDQLAGTTQIFDCDTPTPEVSGASNARPEGTLLLVTHDRALLEAVQVTRVAPRRATATGGRA